MWGYDDIYSDDLYGERRSKSYYDTMQVCLDGHQITTGYDTDPDSRMDFCDKCGKKAIHQCTNCEENIKGYYHSDFPIIAEIPIPQHCHKCGNKYPWSSKPSNSDKSEYEFLNKLKLHPSVVKSSKKLFQDGYFSQAIFEALKMLEQEIKLKSKIRNKVGIKLVNAAFNEKHPIIDIVSGLEQEKIDEREGFRFLYMGAFLGIKNPKSHSNPKLKDSSIALEYLAFISLLMKRLDKSTINHK